MGLTITDQSLRRVQLTADITNNNAVANSIADVTGLLFPVAIGATYWFKFTILYTAQAATTGSRWALTAPASNTYFVYKSVVSLATSGATDTSNIVTANDLPATSNATSPFTTAGNLSSVEGFIKPTIAGNVQLRFASEVSNSAIIARIGSFVEYRVVG